MDWYAVYYAGYSLMAINARKTKWFHNLPTLFDINYIDVYLNISHHNVFTKAKEDIINLTILWPCSEKHNIMLVYILRKRFITKRKSEA